MNKKTVSLLLCLLALFRFAPARAESFMKYTSDYFGTVSMLRLYDTAGAQETWEEVKALLGEIEH